MGRIKDLITDKIIIISDTHIGSIYESTAYLDEVYNYAVNHSITDVIHTGDLIQSTYRNVAKKYRNEEHQIEHLLRVYPSVPSITTNILFGNHDYNTLRKKEEYGAMISSRQDFDILGTKLAFVNWQDNLIALYHRCPKYRVYIPHIDSLLVFCGHSHKLEIKDAGQKVIVPTLSNDTKYDYEPGFLIATIDGENVYIESVKLVPKPSTPELILTKKI